MKRVICYNSATGHREVVRVVNWSGAIFPAYLAEVNETYDALAYAERYALEDTETDHVYYAE